MYTITADPKKLVTIFGAAESQLPFAAAKALNECAVTFQQDMRKVLQGEFIIRRPWVLQGIKINRGDFATKASLAVRVRVDESGNYGGRGFLKKFELGGFRAPGAGKRGLVIPVSGSAAKRNPQSIVPDKLRPKNLELKRVGSRGGATILEGDQRTFMIQRADGSGLILQRKGNKVALKKRRHGPLMKGQRRDFSLVPLFILKPRTRVPSDLHFYDTAAASFARTWPLAFPKWWNEAVRTMNTGAPIPSGQALPPGWQG